MTVARLVLFAVSVGALGIGAERVARRLTGAGDLRVVTVGVLVPAAAVVEALLLGLVGLGGSAAALAVIAIVVGLVVRVAVPAAGPSSGDLARAAWGRCGVLGRAVLGAVTALVLVDTAYLLARPVIGTDGLIYHLAEPAIWIADGHPGSRQATVSGLPIQAYPKTGEVLFTWAIGIARTPVVTTALMVAALVLAAVAAWAVLRRLGVERWVAGTVTAALLLCPTVIAQPTGPNTDLLALTWMICTAALCIGADTEAGLLAAALVAGGLAVGAKSTAIPVVVVVLALAGWRGRARLREHWLALGVAGATALGTGVVWYLQNLAVYQAPFYPFSRFPAGPPLPAIVTGLGARFISDPSGAIRVAGVEGYGRALGAGFVLAAGVLVTLLALPVVRDRWLRWMLAAFAAAAIAETLLWSSAPFTGWSGQPGSRSFVAGGVRYLLPGMAVYAATVGVASRARGPLGVISRVVAVAAIGADLWADSSFQYGIRPPVAALVVAAVVGALIAVGIGRLPAPWLPTGAATAAGYGVTAAIVLVASLGVAAHGYLGRHLTVARGLHIDDPPLLTYLDSQPGWAHGHAPIAIGPLADATLAGPTFDHALSIVTQATPCSVVRSDARRGWLVLPSTPVHSALAGVQTYDKVACMGGTPPATVIAGQTAVFAPLSLRQPTDQSDAPVAIATGASDNFGTRR